MAPLEVEPKAKRNLLESLLVALMLATLGPVYVVYNKNVSWTEGTIICGVVAVAAMLFYSLRFMRKGLRRLRLHDEGLDASMRDGRELRLVWARIKEATLTDNYGGCWFVRYGGGSLEIRDDGFTIDEWEEVSARIRLEMAQVGKDTEVKGMQGLWITHEPVEPGAAEDSGSWSTPWAPPHADDAGGRESSSAPSLAEG